MKLKRTGRIACVAVVILALGVSSAALAAGGVVGTYTTTVSTAGPAEREVEPDARRRAAATGSR